jgi:hypothetical protein
VFISASIIYHCLENEEMEDDKENRKRRKTLHENGSNK